MRFIYNNGGRHTKEDVPDCVTRSISIATGIPYEKVWKDMEGLMVEVCCNPKTDWDKEWNKVHGHTTPDKGIAQVIYKPYLEEKGFEYIKCDGGTELNHHTVALNYSGIVHVTTHLTYVDQGTILDTWDCSDKVVTGYYVKKKRQKQQGWFSRLKTFAFKIKKA